MKIQPEREVPPGEPQATAPYVSSDAPKQGGKDQPQEVWGSITG